MVGNPGISIAFLEFQVPGPQSFDELDQFNVLTSFANGFNAELIDRFIGVCVRGVQGRLARLLMEHFSPPARILRRVRGIEVIVEHSPPFTINFTELLKIGGPTIAIGTFVGLSAMYSPILLATVPGGIIAVGSAITISNVIQDGLPKVIGPGLTRSHGDKTSGVQTLCSEFSRCGRKSAAPSAINRVRTLSGGRNKAAARQGLATRPYHALTVVLRVRLIAVFEPVVNLKQSHPGDFDQITGDARFRRQIAWFGGLERFD